MNKFFENSLTKTPYNKRKKKRKRGKEMIDTRYNNILKYYRRKAKISQKVMSELTGLSKNYISAVERGLHKPSSRMLLTYIKEFNIPLETFFEEYDLTKAVR